MKRVNEFTCANKVARAARSKALLLLSLLPVLAYAFVAPRTATAQSTENVCRETQAVMDQYKREEREVRRLERIKNDMDSFRDMLSSLRRSIANNAADRNSAYLWEALGFWEALGSGSGFYSKTNREQRELQPQLRAALEKAIQTARDTSLDDLRARTQRIENQIGVRWQRFRDLNCTEVLAREKSSSSSDTSVEGCWKWTWQLKSAKGRQDEAVLKLSPGGSASIPRIGLSGTWKCNGASCLIDWGRGAGKEDKMTLSGDTLTGSNFETNWIKGEKIPCK